LVRRCGISDFRCSNFYS